MKLILSKTQSVAFTGHRSIAPEKVPELRRQVRGKIRMLYMLGFRNFVSGMAMGFDMLAAEEVIKLKEELSELKLIAVIPYPVHVSWHLTFQAAPAGHLRGKEAALPVPW